MAVLEWDESFSVNVDVIDSEHKRLIDVMNEYYRVYMATKSKDIRKSALKELLEKLVSYTLLHFSHEEEYFKKFDYKESFEHGEKHREFKKTIIKMKSDIDEGRTVYSLEISNLVREWLLEHIKIEDKKYVKCFNDNGLR